VLPHHDQQASDDENQTEYGSITSFLPSNMLLMNSPAYLSDFFNAHGMFRQLTYNLDGEEGRW